MNDKEYVLVSLVFDVTRRRRFRQQQDKKSLYFCYVIRVALIAIIILYNMAAPKARKLLVPGILC